MNLYELLNQYLIIEITAVFLDSLLSTSALSESHKLACIM